MTDYSKTTFVFDSRLGSRLRELRKRRSLSLRALALLMGRESKGSYNQLARLERGAVKRPSFNLVLDFLRACGARTTDVADLLNAYLRQPPVLKVRGDVAVAELLKSLPGPEQRAMLRWERATVRAREEEAADEPEKKKPRVETERQRVFRVVWSFIHANWNEAFEPKLYEAMLRLKGQVGRSQRKDACKYGRRFFGVLTRHYSSERRKQSSLALVERRAREDGFSADVIAVLLGAATEAHAELLRSGRLDWEPTEEQIVKTRGRAPRVEKAETRLEQDELEPGAEYNRALSLVRVMVVSAVNRRMEELRLDHYYIKRFYFYWIDRLIPIGARHGTGSAEWQAEVDATAPKMHDEAFAREAAALAAETFNRWKVRLPPKPAERAVQH